MSFARLLPLLLLVPALSFADADKNFKVAPNQFSTGSVVEPVANMAVEAKGAAMVSQKPVFPLKSNNLYWRHKKGPKEYQWVQGQVNFTNFKKLHAFSLGQAHLNSFEVAQMRFYASQNKKAFQDEDDLYFDKYFIYSPRVPKLFFIKNGKWQILNETDLPGVAVIKSDRKDVYAAFEDAPTKKLPKAVYPLQPDTYVFMFSAPGTLPVADIGVVKSGEVLVMKPQLVAIDADASKAPDLSVGISDVKKTKNLEETEILFDQFIAELQKVVDLVDTNEFVKLYPKMKSAESVGLYSGEPNYETYRSAYEGSRMKAKSDWLNSNMKGVPELNTAFKKKLDSLQALPLRGSMAPTSFEPVTDKVVEGEDSTAAKMKAVRFKFGKDKERFDVAWEGTAKGLTAEELYKLFTEHASEVTVYITIKQNKPVWIRKDGVITGRHHYRYTRIEFEYQGKNMVGLGDFSLPGYIVDEPEVQEWLNHYDAEDIALQQGAAAEAKAKAAAAKESAKNDTVYAKDAYMPEFTKMSIPRIIRDNTFGAVALIDSGMFRYRGSVVRLSPFAIMTTEMTQKLFDQTMLRQQDTTKRIKDRSSFKNPSKPVHNITWDDARAACKLLGGDLPTEAQWEFAGRADNNEGALWTIDETADVGDYAIYRENSYKRGKKSEAYGPQMVASKKPNAWGIYDMSGNVAEWTRDKYFMFSFWVESSNPTGAMMGFSKVYKGGSWKDGESALNLTKSDDEDPRYWSDAIGFRCVFPRKLFEGR
ncbi:Formylglycine-generating enzyme, required for sulfatase activity, contains SUMF1/FGE domain [Fibrobacter sp. UWT3]|uniref:formylglycine-generating enzyme family protein n=1 Tax=Fibrobacter sp. UWT3 TaxID=1896225 RepID=UPI000BDAF806|nr:SUMF1/EgtB/PvdO family nonheme iron enzyme [Fibrobacter sp. UWT3]SOE54555.1 Formylglycine-generating enzyme, required for sulfatase activity, contains SUMF1/FGE domain [Fibrobacter sp. UWT3]